MNISIEYAVMVLKVVILKQFHLFCKKAMMLILYLKEL